MERIKIVFIWFFGVLEASQIVGLLFPKNFPVQILPELKNSFYLCHAKRRRRVGIRL